MLITETPSPYHDLEKKQVGELLEIINKEDQQVAIAVQKALQQIEKLINALTDKMLEGGRLFYMGA